MISAAVKVCTIHESGLGLIVDEVQNTISQGYTLFQQPTTQHSNIADLYNCGASCWGGDTPVGSSSTGTGALTVCNTIGFIRDCSQHEYEQTVEYGHQQEASKQCVSTSAVGTTSSLVPLCTQGMKQA